MSKLIVHFVSDFLRDTAPNAAQMGETLRCAVLENEINAMLAYGLSQQQINIMITRSREKILQALSHEIGAVMDELDLGPGGLQLNYPQGAVILRKPKILINNGNDRTIELRGTGIEHASTIRFSSKTKGGSINGVKAGLTCEKDVWQRLYVTATLPADTYTVYVTKPSTAAGEGNIELVVP